MRGEPWVRGKAACGGGAGGQCRSRTQCGCAVVRVPASRADFSCLCSKHITERTAMLICLTTVTILLAAWA